MTFLTADFATGVNGNTVATSDTGSANAWDFATKNGTNTLVYDTTHLAHAIEAAKIVCNGSAALDTIGWSTSLGTVTTLYCRAYLYLTANPSGGSAALARGATSSALTSPAYTMYVTTTGKLHSASSAAGLSPDFTNSIALNQLVRLEWKVVCSATVGSLQIWLYNTAEAAVGSPTETQTYTGANTLANMSAQAFGASDTGNTRTFTHWLGNVAVSTAAQIGPFPVISVQPTVSGSTPAGSTLTCDGGTWNGTFTLAYQWTRDGSNIGGATSSTYQTVAGDATHAVGCNVTATGQQATNESAVSSSSNTVTPAAVSTGALPRTRDRLRVFPS